MRAFFWVGALFTLGCGEVVKTQPPDAAIDAVAIDAPIDSPAATAMITGVSTPSGGVEVESSGTVTATVMAAPSSDVTVAFAATLGTYAPATRTITTDVTGVGMASSVFTAGATAGNEAGSVTVTSPNAGTPYAVAFVVAPYSRYGFSAQLTNGGNFGANYLLGQTIATTTAGRLKKIGIISSTASNVKVGLYTNANNMPGTLIAQIPATTLAVGVNEIALASPVSLAAGTYWFMAVYDAGSGGAYTDTAGTRTIVYASHTFATALPATYPAAPTAMTYQGNNFNYYLVVGK